MFTDIHFVNSTTGGSSNDLYTISRPMTQAFLRNDILHGAEATAENLQRATERILEELYETLETSFVSDKHRNNRPRTNARK
jgi:hypothetical protein